jgi:hypothetical protein
MREPKINLITTPDTLFNDNPSVLLVNPSNNIKESLNDILKNITNDLNLYLYEEDAHDDIDWLINVSRSVDYIVLNVDHCDQICWMVGFLLSMSKTFYLTNDNQMQYNIVNVNRIYDISQFAEGVKYFEK